MTPQELKETYKRLYDGMKMSKDVSKMKIFGAAFTDMFGKVAQAHPDIAQAAIDMLAAIEYNNYVTKQEAMDVAEEFINDDTLITSSTEPTRGAHWNMDALKGFLTQRGIALEEKPFYNWPALWLTVNMIYSDYANVVVELIGSKDNERVATACYKMAIKKLKDRDRNHFVREYFDLDD
jgi:hypothetical protein